MNESELFEVERELLRVAEMFGQQNAMDDALYRRRTFEGEPEAMLPLRERVAEKVSALDRLLALHDRTTYERAMRNILWALEPGEEGARLNPLLHTVVPTRVIVEMDGDEHQPWSFDELHDLTEIRAILRSVKTDVERDDGWFE